MGKNENVRASAENTHAENSRDDLGTINGIGPKYAEALYQVGIRHFADLARYSPEALSAALAEKTDAKVPPERIEANDWIGQANVLAQQTSSGHRPFEENADEADVPEKKWHEHAYFSLKFEYLSGEPDQQTWRTHIYREQNGGEELKVDGIAETTRWVNWILDKANLPDVVDYLPEEVETPAKTEAATPDSAEAKAEPAIPEPTTIEILDIQLSEAGPSLDIPEKRLMAEVRFQLSGAEAETLTADRLPYRVEVHAIDLNSQETNLVASGRGELQPQVFEYANQQKFPIPETGRYELHSIVLLLPPGALATYYRGPIVNIVP
jgi:hypothetical protein